MSAALARIAREPGPTLVVSHGGVMRLWLTDVVDPTVTMIKNGEVFALDHDGATVRRA
jgi:broad specificity phosphatase PhoE